MPPAMALNSTHTSPPTLAQAALVGVVFLFFLSAYPQYRTVLIFVAGLGLGHMLWLLHQPEQFWPRLRANWPLLAFVAAAAAISPLALNPNYAWIRSVKLLAEILGGIGFIGLLSRQTNIMQARLTFAAVFGSMLGLSLILGDALTVGGVFNWFKGVRPELVVMNSNSAPLGFAVILLPALLVRLLEMRERALALAFTILALTAIFVLWQWAAKIAVMMAFGGLVAGYFWRRFWIIPLGSIALALVLAWPLALMIDPTSPDICRLWSKPSSVHRLLIWRGAAEKISQRPLLGWGLENARFFPDAEERIVLSQCTPIVGPDDPFMQAGFQRMPIYPHNVFLEIWLNLGALGAMLAGIILTSVAQYLRRADENIQVAAGATLSAVLIYFALGYSLWQGWWLSTLFAATAFMVSSRRRDA